MITKGIRGAITVDNNSVEAIKDATIELLTSLIKENNISVEQISHVIFTLTKDLDAAFPAKFARVNMGWNNVAMMCFYEADIKNALEKCLRILIVVNCEDDFKPQFVYLKGAVNLRNS